MDALRRDLRSYYEAEAQLQSRTTLRDKRLAVVEAFIALLKAEGRSSVVEFGAGPGLDGQRFAAGDLRYIGVDLSVGNARLAHEDRLTVLPADLSALPFAPHTFDAGWSMSTLMHLPEDQVPAAIAEMIAVLRPGAPLCIGLWGGDLGDILSDQGIGGLQRFFSLRSLERNAQLLSADGRIDIEWSTTWDYDGESWIYQLFGLRVG